MAKQTGLNGNIYWGGNTLLGVHNMSIPQVIDKVDTTVYGATYKGHLTTLKSATVSADAKFDSTDVANLTLGEMALLICQLYTGEAIYGTASLLTKTPAVPYDGLVTETLTWEFNGTFLAT